MDVGGKSVFPSNNKVGSNVFMSPNAKSSPGACETPVRSRRLSNIYEDQIYSPGTLHRSSFANLPPHTSPPSRLDVINNPFDQDVRRKLHLSLVSPRLFARVVSPSKDSSEFSWSIDDLAVLNPAEIDEFQNQYEESTNPEVERDAQHSIDRFFDSNPIVPSPWGPLELRRTVSLPTDEPSPRCSYPVLNMSLDDAFSSRCSTPKLTRREASTQTDLSFLQDVPPRIESLLECCHVGASEGCGGTEAVDLRRSSPFHCLWGSPTPVHENLLSSTIHSPMRLGTSRTFGTPLPSSELLSPIGVSPIVHSFQYQTSSSALADSAMYNTWSQTDLSLPQVLPGRVDAALQSYLAMSQEVCDSDEVNLNSSLSRRRKLLFHEMDDELDMSTGSVDNGYTSL